MVVLFLFTGVERVARDSAAIINQPHRTRNSPVSDGPKILLHAAMRKIFSLT
ncbi:MAG: hypothetical protein JW768_16260 [Chitinispirillaceae bacterium]|nr:hypothetical protein [Chitinispirillaceae bacterium]